MDHRLSQSLQPSQPSQSLQPSQLSSLTDPIKQADALLAHPNPDRLFIETRLGNDSQEEWRAYRDGHIHGAVYAQIRDVFAGIPTPDNGNLPLPARDALQGWLRQWQVNADTEIVLYGPSMALAARGWWVLREAGLQNVAVLDGGLKAWIESGGALAQGEAVPLRQLLSGVSGVKTDAITLQSGCMPQATVDEVENLNADTVLIDAREESAYLAGHIPGARNLAASALCTPGGHLRTRNEIRALFAAAGANVNQGNDIVAYCGGGVLSALTVLTFAALGQPARLYVGSWSEWSRNPQRMAKSATRQAETA